MDNRSERTVFPLDGGDIQEGQKSVASIYGEYLEKKNAKKKKGKKVDKHKRKEEIDRYDQYLEIETASSISGYDAFRGEHNRYRKGDVVPEEAEMNLYEDSGFYIGTKKEPNGFVGKPANQDGHILTVGFPGSGKTMGLVIPTIGTWHGSQVILDVKGDLHRYWIMMNKHTGKKVLVFSPGSPAGCGCHYDPYTPLRLGGPENLAGNARDLALALLPLLPSVKDPVWIQAAQNFLTGAIIYYFDSGLTFIETMLELQISTILDILEEIMNDENITAKFYISKLMEVQEKVICNIGMELSNLAALVTDPALITALSVEEGCDVLDWSALNTLPEPLDVILEIPEANLERWRPMLLLMINQLIKSLERRPQRTYKTDNELPPVLVMLDEFPRIGKISAIKNGLATLRSRGVTFALFVQSLVDLEEIYGVTASKVIADLCAYKVVLGVADTTSQQYFSNIVGTTESLKRSINANHDPLSGRVTGYTRSISESREPIIHPHQFLTLEDVVVITPRGFFRVNKTLFVGNEEWFLQQQLLKNPDNVANHPLTFSYQ